MGTNTVSRWLEDLIVRYPELISIQDSIIETYQIMETVYINGGKVLIVGNGGSAADAEHIVGELMKGFVLPRAVDEIIRKELLRIDKCRGEILGKKLQKALPAISLCGQDSLSTAYANDCDPLLCFAQKVYAYGNKEDVLLCLSTSGNSENIVYAAVTARARNMKVIAMTGKKESKISEIADCCIKVPAKETYKVQELHLPIYHTLCLMLEERFFMDR